MTQTEISFDKQKKPGKAAPERCPVECDDCKWKGDLKQLKNGVCPKCKSNNWWDVDKAARNKKVVK